jgi:hypothetical protein
MSTQYEEPIFGTKIFRPKEEIARNNVIPQIIVEVIPQE